MTPDSAAEAASPSTLAFVRSRKGAERPRQKADANEEHHHAGARDRRIRAT